MLATSSIDCVKIWEHEEQVSTKTIDIQNVVSVLFIPPNKHVLLGTKLGSLQLWSIQSNECIQEL
jgi:U3 small nucleolar RNA-associated protein 12